MSEPPPIEKLPGNALAPNAMPRTPNRLDYKEAGVDIDAAAALVEAIKPLARSTDRPGAMGGLGGFGAFFDLHAAQFKDPVLVAATDGAGTKVRIAIDAGRPRTIGIDLVAMCVNDLVVQGAEPLFFLDYFATGKLDPGTAEQVIAGVAEGCRAAGAALIGGETAEMPGMYRDGDYDLAGFAVGAVERDAILDGRTIEPGDVVLGLASSGLHANGFSLVRRIVEMEGRSYDAPAPFAPAKMLGEALLVPTRIYVPSLREALRSGLVKGLAHITGGGITDNLPRSLPENTAARIALGTWRVPPVFTWIRRASGLAEAELLRTFNCGVGMIAIAAAEDADLVASGLEAEGETVFRIGEIMPATDDPARVHYDGALPD